MTPVSYLFCFIFLRILHGYVLIEYPGRIHMGYVPDMYPCAAGRICVL
jgi:hypothetical protein